ncbi:MAG: peptidase, partial [Clostridia bacterium]|nr:peptidase [Clostridia bacterium]
MEQTRAFLKSIGLPGGDAYDLPTSEKRFEDGGQYRFEVPGIQGPKVMEALLEEMDKYGIWLHRVTQTKGIMSLADNDIIEMVKLAKQAQTDLIL